MPRRNNRATPPPTSKKALDHWMQMCRELTEQGQRTLNLKKKDNRAALRHDKKKQVRAVWHHGKKGETWTYGDTVKKRGKNNLLDGGLSLSFPPQIIDDCCRFGFPSGAWRLNDKGRDYPC